MKRDLFPKLAGAVLTVGVLGTVLTGSGWLLMPALLAVTVVYGVSRTIRS